MIYNKKPVKITPNKSLLKRLFTEYQAYSYSLIKYLLSCSYRLEEKDDSLLVYEIGGLKFKSNRNSRSYKNVKRRKIFESIRDRYIGKETLKGLRHELLYQDVLKGVVSLREGSLDEEKDKIRVDSPKLYNLKKQMGENKEEQ